MKIFLKNRVDPLNSDFEAVNTHIDINIKH